MSFSNDMDDEYEKLFKRLNPPSMFIIALISMHVYCHLFWLIERIRKCDDTLQP
ncbi:hypothetical protein NC652_002025 [Populus alba x Populus x berolinensis]|nr:hypothetical protein NC652_002025 [Populus alba x Populus x berolinensis]